MKKINRLLLNEPQTLYWTGFLMADGYLNLKKGKIVCALSKKDLNHLEKLRDYLGGSIHLVSSKSGFGSQCYRLEICGKAIIQEFARKYQFKTQKTYNPPESLIEDENLFYCFLAGLIDGDGSIQAKRGHKFPSIRIEMHTAWHDYLQKVLNKWNEISNSGCQASIKLTNKNSAYLAVNNSRMISHLKMTINNFNLPTMSRKWSIIP